MKRAEALQKVADSIGTADRIASTDLAHPGTAPRTEAVLNWLNIADHWLQLSHNLYDPSPDADVKEKGNQG